MTALTKEELTRLLKTAKQASERDWLMILVAFYHGMRASEVVRLTGNEIRDGYITINRLKGSLKTIQPLINSNDPLMNERESLEQLARSSGDQKLFPITRNWFWYLVKKHCTDANIPSHKCHTHILKHTCGMLAVKSGMGIEDLRQYLGHKSLSSTGAYLKVDDDEAAKAFAKAIGV